MRRIVALVIALVVLCAIAAPAMAEDYTYLVNANQGNTTLVYGVSQTYTMKIPSEVEFAAREGADGMFAEAVIEANDVFIAGDQKLNIAVAAKNREAGATASEDQWYLVDANKKADGVTPASQKVRYSATIEGGSGITKLHNGSVILTVNPPTGDNGTQSDAKGKVTVSFFTEGTAQHGSFKDELTFRVSVDKDKA